MMTSDQVLKHFRDSNALLEGHFVLSSGLHSSSYLQCAIALQYPTDASRFGSTLAARVVEFLVGSPLKKGEEKVVLSNPIDEPGVVIDTVVSPAIGGLVIGYAAAKALNARFIWTERAEGRMMLRRGFSVRPGERILVVEDVITTGGSTRECIAAVEESGGSIIAAASIIDRSGGKADVGVPRLALAMLDVPTFAPDVCPMCENGIPTVKPGSRTAVAG